MAPKAAKKKRRVGLLGVKVTDSEDDSDWQPGDEFDPYEPTTQPSKRRGAPCAADAQLDVPLSTRLRNRASNRTQGSPEERRAEARAEGRARAAAAAPARNRSAPGVGTTSGAAASGVTRGPPRPTPPLPSDVIATIFTHACARQALPTAAAVTCVCRQWRDVALGLPSIWARLEIPEGKADLAVPHRRGAKPLSDALVDKIVRTGRWIEVAHVRFNERKGLTDAALITLAQGCPGLTSLDLTGCTQLRQENMEAVLQALPSLTSLDVSHTVILPRGSGLDAVIRTALTPRPGRVTCSLQKLVASGCPYLSRATMQMFLAAPRAPANLGAAAGSSSQQQTIGALPHLLELRHVDLSGSGTLEGRHQINPERMQAAAPHLEVLIVTGLGGVFGWDVSFMRTVEAPAPAPPAAVPAFAGADGSGAEGGVVAAGSSAAGTGQTDPRGWPNLQVLKLGAAELYSSTGHRECFSCLTNNLLLRLAGRSPRLHTLDLSGCKEFMLTPAVLGMLPCGQSLRVLRLRRCGIGNDAALKVAAAHFSGLEMVDVSGNGGQVTDVGVTALALAAPGLSVLELQGSAVTEQGVRKLLLQCPLMVSLDLSSCRSLSRQLRGAAQTNDVNAINRVLGLPA